MPCSSYIGRFAPSPTGSLHFGSLVTALASYLDAKSNQGQWLVRIEDVDQTRCHPRNATRILEQLDVYGLHWDGAVRYQSQHYPAYQHALNQLIEQQQAFACACTRKELQGQHHHGVCTPPKSTDFAWRFLCPTTFLGHAEHCFLDRVQGRWCEHLVQSLDDFILKRRDGLWAYQLAVVCDDIDQGVTHVVRGIDIIDSTARQALLYAALQQPPPSYAHLPVATNNLGQKLSKQNRAKDLEPSVENTLFMALQWLHQHPPAELQGSREVLLAWAIEHWQLDALSGMQQQLAPQAYR